MSSNRIVDGPGEPKRGTSARYREMIERLFTLSRGGMKLGLEPVARALVALEHPELAFPAVHVAGSNGKGSTCAFLASILAAHGRRVGLYTSPHLVSFTERVRFLQGDDDREIAPDEFVDAVDVVERAVPNFEGLSFFEVTTLAALVAFERRGIDIAVIEAGLGARLDATRLVDAEVAVLTDLSLEHTEILGETLAEIALEEGAVVRADRPLVMADGAPEAMQVVDTLAAQARAPTSRIGDDLHIRERPDGGFDLDLGGRVLEDVALSLIGPHQRRNALLAVKAALLVEPTLGDETIRLGLANARWPGRMEIRPSNPPVLLDGAHNEHGAQCLAAAIAADPERFGDRPLHFVFGAFVEKRVEAMIDALAPIATSVVFTRPSSPRARAPASLVPLWPGSSEAFERVEDALERATARAAADGGWVVVAGSLYLVGDVRALLDAANLRPFSAQ